MLPSWDEVPTNLWLTHRATRRRIKHIQPGRRPHISRRFTIGFSHTKLDAHAVFGDAAAGRIDRHLAPMRTALVVS